MRIVNPGNVSAVSCTNTCAEALPALSKPVVNGILYFAYGSNMSPRRLRQRVGGVEVLGRASLQGYRLRFHKRSIRDGSAKCDVVACPGEWVHGVLYRLPEEALAVLDAFEGNHRGYERAALGVRRESGESVEAQVYLATLIDDRLHPYDWYKRHVLAGAREAGLPAGYVARIEAVEAIPDPDPGRAARELAIYA